MEPTFLATFDDIVARTGVDPKRLVLELTESALTHDPIIAERALDGIRSRGARVYLDDFGTGLSSLGSFRRFAVDGLKLDRSFLDPTVSSRRAAAVIRSGITLARDLGIALIAEGVESLDQVALLQAMGCEDAQGYLFSRPVTPDVLFELLQAPNLQAA
jgi:EAL domain-containing protein (putative c-di-GMP-specific phosphodiesterase class I)